MLKEFLLLGIFIASFLLSNKEKGLAYKILIFSLPFVYRPFLNYDFKIAFGVNSVIVFAIWLQTKLSNRFSGYQEEKILKNIKFFLFFIILYGIALPVIKEFNFVNYKFEYGMNAVESVVNFTISLVITFMFLELMWRIRNDIKLTQDLIKIFLLTLPVHLFYNYLVITGVAGSQSSLDGSLLGRYSGFLGDYELIVDYATIILCFSLILINRSNKYIYFSIFIGALLLGIMSGTRSFFVVLAIFFIIIVISYYLSSKEKIKSIISLVVYIFAFSISIYFLFDYISESLIYRRMIDSYDLFSLGKYEESINRPFSSIFAMIFEYANFIGSGSMIVSELENDPFVFHSFYLSMYLNYGILGAMAVILFIGSVLLKIISKIRSTKVLSKKYALVIYLSAVMSLAVQQYKITLHREVSVILIYVFFLMQLYYELNRENYEKV